MFKRNDRQTKELLQELARYRMVESIRLVWQDSEDELIERFKSIIATPNDNMNPGPFVIMQTAGLVGTVLALKYEKNQDELMKLLKDSDVNFVKEIMND